VSVKDEDAFWQRVGDLTLSEQQGLVLVWGSGRRLLPMAIAWICCPVKINSPRCPHCACGHLDSYPR
jgi:hypothetical protein